MLPKRLLELLRKKLPGWLTRDEENAELKFAELGRIYGAIAFIDGTFVTHLFLDPEGRIRTAKQLQATNKPDGVLLNDAIPIPEKIMDTIFERRMAYLGWLMTSPEFISERNDLRNYITARANEATARALDGQLPGGHRLVEIPNHMSSPQKSNSERAERSFFIQVNGVPKPDPDEETAENYHRFCDRWDIKGFATWELPEPAMGTFSPEYPSLFTFNPSPKLAVPRTLHLPARFRLDRWGSLPEKHLIDWEKIVTRRHRGRLDCPRLSLIFRLFCWRNVALASAYGDRFQGREGKLDEVFAEFFGITEGRVRNARLAMQKLLASGNSSSER